MKVLQEKDPVISRIHQFWSTGSKPSCSQRRQENKMVQLIIRQWDRLIEKKGVLFRRIKDPRKGKLDQVLIREACEHTVNDVYCQNRLKLKYLWETYLH